MVAVTGKLGHCTKNESFPSRISLVTVTFIEKIFDKKFHFLCNRVALIITNDTDLLQIKRVVLVEAIIKNRGTVKSMPKFIQNYI